MYILASLPLICSLLSCIRGTSVWAVGRLLDWVRVSTHCKSGTFNWEKTQETRNKHQHPTAEMSCCQPALTCTHTVVFQCFLTSGSTDRLHRPLVEGKILEWTLNGIFMDKQYYNIDLGYDLNLMIENPRNIPHVPQCGNHLECVLFPLPIMWKSILIKILNYEVPFCMGCIEVLLPS